MNVEEAILLRVKENLSALMRESPLTRSEILARAGLTPNGYDSTWTRNAIKLVWILRILRVLGVSPQSFFDRSFRQAHLVGTEPKILKKARKRMEGRS